MMRNRVFAAARDAASSDDEYLFYVETKPLVFALCYNALLIVLPFLVLFVAVTCVYGRLLIGYSPFLMGLGFLLLWQIFGGLLQARRSPIRISENGITSCDLWGRKLTLSWAEIKTVQTIQSTPMRLPYLIVESFQKDRSVMYLPRYVRSPERFRAAIADHASRNNPLRRFLEDELEIGREPQPG